MNVKQLESNCGVGGKNTVCQAIFLDPGVVESSAGVKILW